MAKRSISIPLLSEYRPLDHITNFTLARARIFLSYHLKPVP